MIDFFMNYCQTIFKRYKDKVKYWMTFNEINETMNKKNPYHQAGILFKKEKIRHQLFYKQVIICL